MRHTALNTKRTLAVLTLALASCRAPMQSATPTPEIVPLRFVVSSNTTPLFHTLAAQYQQDNALVSFVDQSDLGMTVQQVLTHSPDATPRDTRPTYAITTYLAASSNLWAAPIGQDGIAIIAHNSVQLNQLTANDLRSIFTGAITRWSQFNRDLNGDIILVSPGADDPTRQTFQALVLGDRQISFNARLAPTTNAMLEIVATTPGAIGFISAALVHPDSMVQVIPLALTTNDPPILPTVENIYNETYPLRMPILIVGSSPPEPGDGYYEFVLWAQTKGQTHIREQYAPLPTGH